MKIEGEKDKGKPRRGKETVTDRAGINTNKMRDGR